MHRQEKAWHLQWTSNNPEWLEHRLQRGRVGVRKTLKDFKQKNDMIDLEPLIQSLSSELDWVSLLSPNNYMVSAFYTYWVTLLERERLHLYLLESLELWSSPLSSLFLTHAHQHCVIPCVSLLSICFQYSGDLQLRGVTVYVLYSDGDLSRQIQSPWHWCLQSTLEWKVDSCIKIFAIGCHRNQCKSDFTL